MSSKLIASLIKDINMFHNLSKMENLPENKEGSLHRAAPMTDLGSDLSSLTVSAPAAVRPEES